MPYCEEGKRKICAWLPCGPIFTAWPWNTIARWVRITQQVFCCQDSKTRAWKIHKPDYTKSFPLPLSNIHFCMLGTYTLYPLVSFPGNWTQQVWDTRLKNMRVTVNLKLHMQAVRKKENKLKVVYVWEENIWLKWLFELQGLARPICVCLHLLLFIGEGCALAPAKCHGKGSWTPSLAHAAAVVLECFAYKAARINTRCLSQQSYINDSLSLSCKDEQWK